MTMIAACRFDVGVVLIADSRATWATATPIYRDSLQKLLHLDAKIAVGFCGDVYAAAFVVNEIRKRIARKPRLRLIRKLIGEVPRLARHGYGLCKARYARPGAVELILAGVTESGAIEVCHFRSPYFDAQRVDDTFIVRGSGDVVREYLANHIDEIRARPSLKEKADSLVVGLESELQRRNVPSVGGLFQVLLLEPRGIRPLRYGFLNLDPDAPAEAKNIEMRAGKWIQRDDVSKTELTLGEPASFFATPAKPLRVHDLQMPKTFPRWHLTYFVTCLSYDKRIGSVEFAGTVTKWAAEYPIPVRVLVALALWGSPGDYSIEIRLVTPRGATAIAQKMIHVDALMVEAAGAEEVSLPIASPGPAYLECWIDNRQLFARRALYFGELLPERENETEADYSARQAQALQDIVFEDPEIGDSDRIFVSYFTLCRQIHWEPMVLRFDQMPAAVYAKEYPVSVRFAVATGFRGKRGTHALRIDLVNAATRVSREVVRMDVESRSSSVVTELHGDLAFPIPEPGIYFVSLVINESRVATAILPAETPAAEWSYALRPEDAARVEGGELLALLRGSQTEEEAREARGQTSA